MDPKTLRPRTSQETSRPTTTTTTKTNQRPPSPTKETASTTPHHAHNPIQTILSAATPQHMHSSRPSTILSRPTPMLQQDFASILAHGTLRYRPQQPSWFDPSKAHSKSTSFMAKGHYDLSEHFFTYWLISQDLSHGTND
jgi:hypothetical protein